MHDSSTSNHSDVCAICGGTSDVWLPHPDRPLRRCSTCGFRWIPQGVARSSSGRTIYDDEASVFFAAGGADYYLDETARDAAAAKLAWVMRYASGGSLLDVGANVGFFVAGASAAFAAQGIEPNVHAVAWARQHASERVAVGSIYDPRPDFAGRFNAITMFDVIEHLADPRAALGQCREWLADGGRLFITTPNTASVAARVLGRHWYYIDLTEHVSLFSVANLERLLNQEGLRMVAQRTIGRRYKFSYIEQRLGYLGRTAPVMRLAHLAAQPLRLLPNAVVTLNFGDAVGIVAERAT